MHLSVTTRSVPPRLLLSLSLFLLQECGGEDGGEGAESPGHQGAQQGRREQGQQAQVRYLTTRLADRAIFFSCYPKCFLSDPVLDPDPALTEFFDMSKLSKYVKYNRRITFIDVKSLVCNNVLLNS